MEVRAHMDGGAQVTTTDNLSLLWHDRLLPADYKPPALKVADNTAHYPIGYGYLKVPCLTGDGHELILCFYTPSLPATIMLPDRIGRAQGCKGYNALSFFDPDKMNQCQLHLFNCRCRSEDIRIALTSIRGLLFTDVLVPPTPAEHAEA